MRHARSKQQSSQDLGPESLGVGESPQGDTGNAHRQEMLRAMQSAGLGDAGGGDGRAVPYRREMEALFGADFSGVRAYLGEAGAMGAVGAEGASLGEEVSFAEPNPSRELVAHELAHVVQSRTGGGSNSGGSSRASGSAEDEAQRVAAQVARGEPAGPIVHSSGGLGLQESDGPAADDATGGAGGLAVYQAALRDLYQKIDAGIAAEIEYMRSKGVPDEVIAKWAVEARNKAKAKARTWDALKRWAELRNQAVYGDPIGPSYEQLKTGDASRGLKPKTDAKILDGATRTNAGVNKWTGRMRVAGRIMIILDLGVSAYHIATATPEDRPKVFIREAAGFAGALAGGWLGAKGGAAAGGAFGGLFAGIGAAPGALVGGILGGIGGAIAGAWGGGMAGDWIVNELYPPDLNVFEPGQ